jgi:hypothetical protein
MAARRLLIVMLVLLGLSTLAAALVPQRHLRREATATTTATQPAQTPTVAPPGGRTLAAEITVGTKKGPPVIAGPVCVKGKAKCGPPFHVGDQITLLVLSTFPTQLEIKQFGLISFATPQAPARFELLPSEPSTYGVLYAPSGKVAARLEVLPAGAKAKSKQKRRGKKGKPAKSGARGGSGQS